MRSARFLAIATAVVFCISTIFPVAAALHGNASSLPKIVGVIDVIVAFTLVGMAIVLYARMQGRVTTDAEHSAYGAYRVLTHSIVVLLLVFFLFGDRIAWSIGLVGIAWRAWLLFYTLPTWYTALNQPGGA